MSDRFTADTITDDGLDELYARSDWAEAELARLHEGEEEGCGPHTVATPGQWIYEFNRAPAAKRLAVVAATIQAAQRGNTCFLMAHEKRLAEDRQAWVKLARGQEEVARWKLNTLEPQTMRAISDIGRALDGEEQP